MWIFAYGSLLWRIDFPYRRRLNGYIKGYSRRLWQGSEDHRGTHAKPGRVVTLIDSTDPEERVPGIAYEISEHNASNVTTFLDHRERGGYKRITTTFTPFQAGFSPMEISIYVGIVGNPFYLGPASADVIAKQIFVAEGDSGTNLEYFQQLVNSVRSMASIHNEPHLLEIEHALKRLYPEDNASKRQRTK